jgi:hypothetical protein
VRKNITNGFQFISSVFISVEKAWKTFPLQLNMKKGDDDDGVEKGNG